MSNNNQEINPNQQKLSTQSKQLAKELAAAKVEIMTEAAWHEYQAYEDYYTKLEMKKAAERIHKQMVKKAELTVENLAEFTTNRAIEIETETTANLEDYAGTRPQFASFKSKLESKRSEYNKMARWQDKKTLNEIDEAVLFSLGETDNDEDNEAIINTETRDLTSKSVAIASEELQQQSNSNDFDNILTKDSYNNNK